MQLNKVWRSTAPRSTGFGQSSDYDLTLLSTAKATNTSTPSLLLEYHRSESHDNSVYSIRYPDTSWPDVSKKRLSLGPLWQSLQSNFRRTILRSGPAYTQPPQDDASTIRHYSRFSGWRGGVLASTVGVAICVVVETILIAITLNLYKPEDGLGTIYSGNCDRVNDLSNYLLLLLNAIGTVTVGSTNYVMQTLNAPSRKEVNQAHAKGVSLNIGISSPSNLPYLRKRKSILYCVLGISTVPIHLLLNSSIFASLQANNYGVMIVSQNFLQDSSWTMYNGSETMAGRFLYAIRDSAMHNATNFATLDPATCISTYGSSLQSRFSNVILVTNATTGQWANFAPPKVVVMTDACGWTDQYQNVSAYDCWQFSLDHATGDISLIPENINYDSVASVEVSTNGLFLAPADPLWGIQSLRGVFNAFDFKYWAVAEGINYEFNDSRAVLRNQWEPPAWLCDEDYTMSGRLCSSTVAAENASEWKVTPTRFDIDHCLSTSVQPHCTLQYSLPILIIIFGCEIIKLGCMAAALIYALVMPRGAEFDLIATVGDAVASFLNSPDTTSGNRCLLDRQQVSLVPPAMRIPWYTNAHFDSSFENFLAKLSPGPTGYHSIERRRAMLDVFGCRAFVWKIDKKRRSSVPTRRRWVAFLSLYFVVSMATLIILAVGVYNLKSLGLAGLWAQGLGAINPNAVFAPSSNIAGSDSGIIQEIVLINLPQLFLSTLYFLYNGLFTCMLAGREWSLLGTERKSLRVSNPTHQQRSSYWLSLPWRYSLPLVALSSLIHWLVSRSLFLVRILVFDHNNQPEPSRDISTCGYSPLAILIVIGILLVMGVALLACGRQFLSPGIPVVGLGSWAISAACHQPLEDKDAALKPLKWGVTWPAIGDEPGHCCLTSQEVEKPVVGHSYI